MISYCSFNLCFPNNLMILSTFLSAYWTFIYLLWEVFVHIFCPFKKLVVILLKVFFFILTKSSLSDLYVMNTFTWSLGCLFIFLMVSFDKQKLSFWWGPNESFLFIVNTFYLLSKTYLPIKCENILYFLLEA